MPLVVAVCVTLLTACAAEPEGHARPKPTGDGSTIYDTHWSVDAFTVYDSLDDLGWGDRAYVVFSRDGSAYGNAGCNDFTARAEITEEYFLVSDLRILTDRKCVKEAQAMEDAVLYCFGNKLLYAIHKGVFMRAEEDTSMEKRHGLHFKPRL